MRKQYVDFLDRFDGGGAGQTGNSFQGGGLLSALGNLFANPYGSEDQARRAQRRQALGLLDTAASPAQARPAPFAPRTAPRGDITTSVLPQPIPSHLTGPKMGMPQPQIPSHLTGPKMGMPQPLTSPLGALDEITTTMQPNAAGVQPSYQSVTNLNDGFPMLADPTSRVQPATPYNDNPVPVQTDMPTAASHTPPSNFTDEDYVMMAAQNPAFEAWLMGQPGVLSLPDQAKRFLNLQLINQGQQ